MIDAPSEAFREAARQAAASAGRFLSNDALDALVAAADADEGLRYLTRYAPEPPLSLVSQKLAPFFAKEEAAPKGSKWGRESGGVDPAVFAKLGALQRLTLVREFDAKHGAGEKPAGKTSREKRLAADLHGARLRLHALQGEAREAQSQRIAALEAELQEARGR